MRLSKRAVLVGLTATICVSPGWAQQKSYGQGVTDTEIKIGQTMPYSGPASSFSAIGKAMAAYFAKVNKEGGVNGRMINLLSLDDAYSPPKAVEQTRNLIENHEVFAIVGSFGSPSNFAIQKYLNAKKVPSLFLGTGANRFSDPKNFPWSMGWQPNNLAKGRIYAKFILKTRPAAKIAILYQNDDFGKDYARGVREGLGSKAATMIVAEKSYEISEPTIDSQLQLLRASGADVFVDLSTPKFAAQAIKRVAETKWDVLHLLSDASGSITSTLIPAGLENAKGVITVQITKDPGDPKWANDPAMKEYFEFMKEYMPGSNPMESYHVFGIATAQTFVHVLQKCGDNLTRENLMKQAASINDLVLPLMRPGIKLSTSATQFTPLHQEQIVQFDGTHWVDLGEVISAD